MITSKEFTPEGWKYDTTENKRAIFSLTTLTEAQKNETILEQIIDEVEGRAQQRRQLGSGGVGHAFGADDHAAVTGEVEGVIGLVEEENNLLVGGFADAEARLLAGRFHGNDGGIKARGRDIDNGLREGSDQHQHGQQNGNDRIHACNSHNDTSCCCYLIVL